MFGSKDLTLLLPDKAGDLVSLRHTNTETENIGNDHIKSKTLDVSKKVTRYFPGKAPIWMQNEDIITSSDDKKNSTQGLSNVDRRLARLVNTSSINSTSRRRVREAKVINLVPIEENPAPVSSSYDNIAMLEDIDDEYPFPKDANESSEYIQDYHSPGKRKIIESTVLNNVSKHTIGFDEEETYTSSAEDEEDIHLIKPVFVPKRNRITIKDVEQEELVLNSKSAKKEREIESRKEQTREMVATIIRANESKELEMGNYDEGQPDDTDDPSYETEDFNSWKLREILRLTRDSERREVYVMELADLERRRAMTDEERMKEDKELGKFDKDKTNWKFLQKYYHKGAFYMDEDSTTKAGIRDRSFNEPTLEDKFDRESLPKIMQVKKFGMRGQTKYTHLIDQDTSNLKQNSFGKGIRKFDK